jgi:hypothetical protein
VIFQSTLPVWGATRLSGYNLFFILISIHAPRVGSDSPPNAGNTGAKYFNPRSPCGERPQHMGKKFFCPPYTGRCISIRSIVSFFPLRVIKYSIVKVQIFCEPHANQLCTSGSHRLVNRSGCLPDLCWVLPQRAPLAFSNYYPDNKIAGYPDLDQ